MKNNDFRLHFAVTIWLFAILCLNQAASNDISDQDCGLSSRRLHRRIVGGVRSETCELPWVVVVMVGSDQCGGSIIDDRHVLTAAHCVEGFGITKDTPVTVLGGSNRRDNMTAYDVQSWVKHPERVEGELDFDVAVLTLADEMKFGRCLSSVCLPTPESSPADHDECTAAGWGHNEDKETTFYQMKVNLPFVNDQTCSRVFEDNYDNTKLCAGDYAHGGRDTCQGDSGGPLMCRSNDGPFYQYGIVSFGHGCGLPFYPGVYTRVNHPLVLEFILDAVQDV